MAKTLLYRGTRIIALAEHETIADFCRADDIAIVKDASGWWTCFIGENGIVDRYDIAFDSFEKALQTARAAAEYSGE
jgi:hypothetical protein